MNIGNSVPNVPPPSGMSTQIFSRAMIRVMALMLIFTGVITSWGKPSADFLREQSLSKLDEVRKSLEEVKRLSMSITDRLADAPQEEESATATVQGFTKAKPPKRKSLDAPAKTVSHSANLKEMLLQISHAVAVCLAIWMTLLILLFWRPSLVADILRSRLPETLDSLTAVRIAFRLIGSYLMLLLPMVVSGYVVARYYLPPTKLDWSKLWPFGIMPGIGLVTVLLNRPLARLVLWKIKE